MNKKSKKRLKKRFKKFFKAMHDQGQLPLFRTKFEKLTYMEAYRKFYMSGAYMALLRSSKQIKLPGRRDRHGDMMAECIIYLEKNF